ncbi:lipid II:glycine glycyltransferase FemX, partial [Patescibacteria group bacterium]
DKNGEEIEEQGDLVLKAGFKVIRLGAKENNKLVATATLIKKPLLSNKSYFFCPRGPILDKLQITNYKLQIEEVYNKFFKHIRQLAGDEGCVFLRFEPRNQLRIKNYELRITKTIDVQPSKTLILDIKRPEGDILNQMHHKTRYNIRLAEKKGVIVRKALSDDFEKFWNIMEETRTRDGFRLHPKDHYEKMLDLNNMILLVAEYNNKIIAGMILSVYGDMGTYVHGASSNQYRNVMASHLLQWQAIKITKSKSCNYYDFNGIDEAKWLGVTRFKKGFGGEIIDYPGTYDLVVKQILYRFYLLLRRIRRVI